MGVVSDTARSALEPWVGPMVADTCVRATAISLGKTTDDLSAEDIPALEASIRRLLAPVAPAAAVNDVVAKLTIGLRGVA